MGETSGGLPGWAEGVWKRTRALPEEKLGEKVGIFHRWLLHPKCGASLVSLHLSRLSARRSHLCVPRPEWLPPPGQGKKQQPKISFEAVCLGCVTGRFRGKDWKPAGRPVTKVRRCYLSAASAPSSLVFQQGPSFMRSPKPTEAHVISTLTSLRRLIVATSDWRAETSSKQTCEDVKTCGSGHRRHVLSHWNFTRMFKRFFPNSFQTKYLI